MIECSSNLTFGPATVSHWTGSVSLDRKCLVGQEVSRWTGSVSLDRKCLIIVSLVITINNILYLLGGCFYYYYFYDNTLSRGIFLSLQDNIFFDNRMFVVMWCLVLPQCLVRQEEVSRWTGVSCWTGSVSSYRW